MDRTGKHTKTYKLLGADGKVYQSEIPGTRQTVARKLSKSPPAALPPPPFPQMPAAPVGRQ